MKTALSPCLDEDDMLAFASGKLEPTRRRDAMAHVDECESCRDLAAELARDAGVGSEVTSASKKSDGEREDHEEEEEEEKLGDLIEGRFRLIEPIGRGAMGTVYRAHDEKLGMDVALKLLRAERSDSKELGAPSARAFARELKAGRRVTHPNVCRLHDAGHLADGRSYITMELLSGETLAALLAREEPTQAHAIEILQGVAAGLAAAHAQGIVHRDLKPANVMLVAGGPSGPSGKKKSVIDEATKTPREGERAVLTDFGFAADLESKQSRRLVGTPAFWAPEQARGEPATPASDVYSLGLLAYRLLAGREWSLSEDQDESLHSIPRSYRRFIRACLEPRPSDRPEDASKAIALLRQDSRIRPSHVAIGSAATFLVLAILRMATQSTPPGSEFPARPAPETSSAPSASSAAPAVLVLPTTPTPRAASATAHPENSAQETPEKPLASATRPVGLHPLAGGGVPPHPIASTTPSATSSSTSSSARPLSDPLYRH